jgi:hypothetical protein
MHGRSILFDVGAVLLKSLMKKAQRSKRKTLVKHIREIDALRVHSL